MNNIFDGNHGEKWQVVENISTKEDIYVKLVKMDVEEIIIKQEI